MKYKCDFCGNITNKPKEYIECYEYYDEYLEYITKYSCPLCGNDMKQVEEDNKIDRKSEINKKVYDIIH